MRPPETLPASAHYRAFLFDCDGVLLNSNVVKTEAFYKAALPWGERAATELVEYHVSRGGVSRYEKFRYFLAEIVGQTKDEQAPLEQLLDDFARHVREGLMQCEEAPGLRELLACLPAGCPRYVVSGGDQQELRRVFRERGLADGFDAIYGSPVDKRAHVKRLLEREAVQRPSVFFGDAWYDYEVASEAGLDFVFLHGWSEVSDWCERFSNEPVWVCRDLSEYRRLAAG